MKNNKSFIKMLTEKMSHVVEFFSLGWDIFWRPKKKIKEWNDSSFALKDRVDSIVQGKFTSHYIGFTLGLSTMAASLYILSQTHYGIFPMMMLMFSINIIGIVVCVCIKFITASMLLYGNNFNCPKCLLPFVVLNFYFSYIVYSRYKEMFLLTTKSYENMKENSTEKGFHSKNDVISSDKDEQIYIDVVTEECNSFYIFLDNQYDDSGTKNIFLPDVHKYLSNVQK